MNLTNNYTILMPKKTLIGVDCINNLGYELKKLNIRKSLIVTDSYMFESGLVKKIEEILEVNGILSHIYYEVTSNPTIEQVERGAEEYIKGDCDSIVTLGGGSPHDCGKAIKLAMLDGFNIQKIPLAAINTTAGTASEVTQFSIITDISRQKKLSIIDERIIPDIAVDDPNLMVNMPPGLTAATGMDALSHALEAYVSIGRNPITSCIALEAISLIRESLLIAYQEPKNIIARSKMVYAQYLAGLAFSNAGLGMIHAIAHQLGGYYDLPHGVCNATLLPYVIEYNCYKESGLYAHISRRILLCNKSLPDKIAANKLISYLFKLNQSLNLPLNIKDLGVKNEDIEILANMTLVDPSLKNNPRKGNFEDIKNILHKAYNGN